MKQKLAIRRMRQRPDLEQLRRQSKELLTAFRAADAAAVNEVTACYDDPQLATFALHDAQLVIARSYGFDSWPKLKAYVDGVTIRRLVEAVSNGAIERVTAMLKTRPELANMAVSYGDEHRDPLRRDAAATGNYPVAHAKGRERTGGYSPAPRRHVSLDVGA